MRLSPRFSSSSSARGTGLAQLAAGALLVASCSVVAACGGSKASEAHAPEASTEAADARETRSAAEPVTAEPPAPRCDDGSCFECGEGLCPQGFYCDRNASGGPACSWVPDCAKKPTCACLVRTLGKSCSCEDSGGGPTVSCE